MNVLVPDYLYSEEIYDINNEWMYSDCLQIEDYLKRTIPEPEPMLDYGSFTSANHMKYNLFNFHLHSVNDLYRAIQTKVRPHLPDDRYMIQCWLNVFRKGQFIDWHGHWPEEFKVWHGFYCVNVGDSTTTYKFGDTETVVQDHNGLIVFGKSAGDVHRSSEWDQEDKHRITIAFDIIPIDAIAPDPVSRHYLPL